MVKVRLTSSYGRREDKGVMSARVMWPNETREQSVIPAANRKIEQYRSVVTIVRYGRYQCLIVALPKNRRRSVTDESMPRDLVCFL